jgi:acetyl esterase
MRLIYLGAKLTAFLPARLQIKLSGEPPVIVDGQQLDPQVQFLRALRKRRVRYGLVEPTVEAGRARYRRESAIFNPRPTRVRAVRDLEAAGLRARLYSSGDASAPLTVYFHGGGFVIGDLDTHDEPCRMLCRHSGSHVLSVAYRLAPEHPYPAAVKDALAAFRWARQNAESLGADPKRVAVGGDSAGANLAATVAVFDAPFAQLLFYPPTDETTDRPSRHLFDKGFFLSMNDHAAFRTYYAPEVLALEAGRAPALVVVAGFDILRDEVEAYAAKLPRAQILRFPGLGHGFIHMTTVARAARRAVIAIAQRWRAMLDQPSS